MDQLAFSVGVTLRGEWLGDFVSESFSADEANRRLRRGNTVAHKSRVGERYRLLSTVDRRNH